MQFISFNIIQFAKSRTKLTNRINIMCLTMITNKFANVDATVTSGVCNVCKIMFVKLCT